MQLFNGILFFKAQTLRKQTINLSAANRCLFVFFLPQLPWMCARDSCARSRLLEKSNRQLIV